MQENERPIEVRSRRRQGWFWVENSIVDRIGQGLGSKGIAVYVALCRYADLNTQSCYPSIGKLSKSLKMGRNVVNETLSLLESQGLISCTRSGAHSGFSNCYTLLSVPDEGSTEVVLPSEAGVVLDESGSSTESTPEVVLPQYLKEDLKEEKKEGRLVQVRFHVFISNFPPFRITRESEKEALKEWRKLRPEQQRLAVESLEKWKESEDWSNHDGKYIPTPANFLKRDKYWRETPSRPATEGKRSQGSSSRGSRFSEEFRQSVIDSLH